MTRLEIRELTRDLLDDAAALLADRHRAHRRDEPALDVRHESVAVAREDLEAAVAAPDASGVAATRGGRVVGYLVGAPKDPATWGGNVWIEAAGHAASEPGAIRELYAAIAGRWVDEGRTNQHVLVPATNAALVDAWFSLDFGQQHVHAVVETPAAPRGLVPRDELVVRRATRRDIAALAELELVLPRHLGESPIFSKLPIRPIEEVTAELEADVEDPAYAFFVAEHGGDVIASAVGCSLEASSIHLGPNRPPNAAYLAHAAVLPRARGLGAGRAVGEAVLQWAAEAGYPVIATEWRSTNLEADRTWRSLGFRSTFRRLHRLIG